MHTRIKGVIESASKKHSVSLGNQRMSHGKLDMFGSAFVSKCEKSR